MVTHTNTGRLFRHGEAAIAAALASVFERLGCSGEGWQTRMDKLRAGRLLGRFFTTTRVKLRKITDKPLVIESP